MKKIIGIIFLSIIISGCGKLKEDEALVEVLDSLENAYLSTYIVDGVGLPVYAEESKNIDGVTWYKVASEYDSVASLKKIVDSSLDGDLKKEYDKKIDSKYKDIEGSLYTTSEGGCALPFNFENAREEIEKITKITKIKSNKIEIKVSDKEYTLKKSKDNWLNEEKIFGCE